MRTGFFASEFGRGYYLGFIDQSPDFAAVSFAGETGGQSAVAGALEMTSAVDMHPRLWLRPARLLFGAGVMPPIAHTFDVTTALRFAAHPAGDRGFVWSIDVAGARGTEVAEWRAAISGGWIWSAPLGPVRGWLGAMAGAGMIGQSASGQPDRYSGTLSIGPTSGVTLDLGHRVGIWGEVLFSGLGYRRDDQSRFAVVPAAFLGASFGL